MKIRFRIPGFYGVLTQHFGHPDVVFLPHYTSTLFSEHDIVFVTKYPDVDKNSILPLKVRFHQYPTVSVHIDRLKQLDADIDGDCVAVWKGDTDWEIDQHEPTRFKPLNSLMLSDIKQRAKKLIPELVEELLNCKIDFNSYLDDVHLRFHIVDKAPMLTGTLFKRLALKHYKMFFYDLKDNVRFVYNPRFKLRVSESFLNTTKNYDIWIRSVQIICSRLNTICMKLKHPVISISNLRKVLTFLKLCDIDISYFEKELGVTYDARYQKLDEFTFWFEKDIEKDAFKIFRVGVKTNTC